MVIDEGSTHTGPEIVVFAAFSHPPKYPVRVSALTEMVRILQNYIHVVHSSV